MFHLVNVNKRWMVIKSEASAILREHRDGVEVRGIEKYMKALKVIGSLGRKWQLLNLVEVLTNMFIAGREHKKLIDVYECKCFKRLIDRLGWYISK